MFENIRNVLDEIEEVYSRRNETLSYKYPLDPMQYIDENGCKIFEDKLVKALYKDVNIYWLCRKLKLLSDSEVPEDYKRMMLK